MHKYNDLFEITQRNRQKVILLFKVIISQKIVIL